jgi:hypothetical protein
MPPRNFFAALIEVIVISVPGNVNKRAACKSPRKQQPPKEYPIDGWTEHGISAILPTRALATS